MNGSYLQPLVVSLSYFHFLTDKCITTSKKGYALAEIRQQIFTVNVLESVLFR
jgi:hypothetical protein